MDGSVEVVVVEGREVLHLTIESWPKMPIMIHIAIGATLARPE